jgi:hypothetical protein
MARGGDKHRRKQRAQRDLERRVGEYQERPDHHDGPSGGQFYVVNMDTGEKTPGLNLKEAQALWRSLPRAFYLEMKTYTPGKIPGARWREQQEKQTQSKKKRKQGWDKA